MGWLDWFRPQSTKPPEARDTPWNPQRGPLDLEKLRSAVPMMALLPYYDEQQSVGETQQMRMAYRLMMADPNVKPAILGKTLSVMASELQIRPPARFKKDPRYQQHAEFLEHNFKHCYSGGVPALVWEILHGYLIDGISVCERVWDVEDYGVYRGKRILTELKAKDVNQDLALEINAFKDIVAIKGLRYNAGEEFDPRDFVISRHLPMFGNPSGMSDLRAAYSRYWILDTALKLRAAGAQNRAFPTVAGKFTDAKNQATLDKALAALRSQTWASVPKEIELQVLELAGSGPDILQNLCRDMREEIAMSIQGAVLSSMTGGEGQQRGDSNVHKDRSDLWSWHLSAVILSIFNDRRNGLIRDLTDRNFANVDEYCEAIFGGIDEGELKESLEIDKGLVELGWQLDREELEERYGRKWQDDPDKAVTKQPPPGGPPGGMPPMGGEPPSAPDGGGAQPPSAPPQAGESQEKDDPQEQAGGAVVDGESQRQQVPTPKTFSEAPDADLRRVERLADVWNHRAELGHGPTMAEIDAVDDELDGSEWALDFDPETRQWSAIHVDDQDNQPGEVETFAESDWRHDPGPRSANRWRNVSTGKIKYSTTNPGKGKGEPKTKEDILLQPTKYQRDKAAAKKVEAQDARRQTVAATRAERVGSVHAKVGDMLQNGATAADHAELLPKLEQMTLAELRDLKQKHGLKASAPVKKKLIEKLASQIKRKVPTEDEIRRRDLAAALDKIRLGEKIRNTPWAQHLVAHLKGLRHENGTPVFAPNASEADVWKKLKSGELYGDHLDKHLGGDQFARDYGSLSQDQLHQVLPHLDYKPVMESGDSTSGSPKSRSLAERGYMTDEAADKALAKAKPKIAPAAEQKTYGVKPPIKLPPHPDEVDFDRFAKSMKRNMSNIEDKERISGTRWIDHFLVAMGDLGEGDIKRDTPLKTRWEKLKNGDLWGHLGKVLNRKAFKHDYGSMTEDQLRVMLPQMKWTGGEEGDAKTRQDWVDKQSVDKALNRLKGNKLEWRQLKNPVSREAL